MFCSKRLVQKVLNESVTDQSEAVSLVATFEMLPVHMTHVIVLFLPVLTV